MKTKTDAPTAEQWDKLYDIAIKLKALSPWEHRWDTDLFTLSLPGQEESLYVSVIGRNGECYGIGVYLGARGLLGFNRIIEANENDRWDDFMHYQNCLMFYCGNREELAPQEREIIKSLNLKFRGENNWIYFRAMEEGCYPWLFNAAQAQLMTEALQNFYMAFKYYISGEIIVNFDGGQTLLRFYSEEQKKWLNTAAPLSDIPVITENVTFTDELLLQRLKSSPKNTREMELDIRFLPVPVQDNPEQTPYFPRIIVLLDRKNKIILQQEMLEKEDKTEIAVAYALTNFFLEHGRPGKLFVRNEYIHFYVESLCSQLGIPTAYGKGMPAANTFIRELEKIYG